MTDFTDGKWRSLVDGTEISTSAIPDTVEYQVRSGDFADPWPFNIGSTSMSVYNQLNSSTFTNGATSVFGDGVDDYGLASMASFGDRSSFGLAFTVEISTDNFAADDVYFGRWNGSNARFTVRSYNAIGRFGLYLYDGSAPLEKYTDSTYDDGSSHAVIINKSSDSASDVDIFVDDMSTPASASVRADTFNSSNYTNSEDMAFYALNDAGSILSYSNIDAGVFEFNSQPYTESERNDFISRRPEV